MEFNEETLKIIEKVAAANGGWNNIHGVDIKSSHKPNTRDKDFFVDNGFLVGEYYSQDEECWVLSITKKK